jgi:hypothetical protein
MEIERYDLKIANNIKSYRILYEFFDEFWDFISHELVYASDLYLWSFENILLRECPKAHIFYIRIETEWEDRLNIVTSSLMSDRYDIRELSCPSPIPIHDEPDMSEHTVYKKIPRV